MSERNVTREQFSRRAVWVSAVMNQNGMTLMTVMMILLIMSVVGVAALTVTNMENTMAGAMRTVEAAADAAESCIGVSENVIKAAIGNGSTIPGALQSSATPAGPVPAGNVNFLNQEIIGSLPSNADVAFVPGGGAGAVPNVVLTIQNYQVFGDIDYLYLQHRAGSNSQGSDAYGSPVNASNSTDKFYRIDCWATNAATGNTSRVTTVYDCFFNGSSCQ